MLCVIDSCVWIAYKSKRDQDHKKAVSIMNRFMSEKSMGVYIPDYVVLEVTNFLLRKMGPEVAFNTLNLFNKHERIRIVIVDEILFERGCELATMFKISLADASIVAMMADLGINTLYSFDSGFDKVGWVKRNENA